MAVESCRLCGRRLYPEPLLHYDNMPQAAQHFPDAAAIQGEHGADLTIVQCSSCGLVQLDGEPVPYYREVIRAAGISDVIRDFKTQQFRDFIARFSLHGKKVIEIGCGCGEFLALLDPLNVTAYGIEYGDAAVAHCRRQGLRVAKDYLEPGVVLEDGPFDAFFLLMFLEHMPEPNAALKALYDNLTPGAVGLVEVPNFDMMLRNRLFSEFIADHLVYFTAESLRTTLHTNGFEVLEFAEMRDEYVLAASVRRRERLDLSHFRQCQSSLEQELHRFIDGFEDKKVAVWGAGHQSLAVIALTKVAPRLRYIVDSAPFKQGRFTPATHVPIVPPQMLRQDPVDAVIVICGSYSDEVAGVLQRDFDANIAVSILRDFGLETIRQPLPGKHSTFVEVHDDI